MGMTAAPYRLKLGRIASAAQSCPTAAAVDLANLAAAAYDSDRRCRRGATWRRRITLRAQVAELGRWIPLRDSLGAALGLLTDDDWEIRIEPGRAISAEEAQPWLLSVEDARVTSIALFSGGLDSFAGAGIWLANNPCEVLGLLSVRTSTVAGAVQRNLAAILDREYPGRVWPIEVPLNLKNAPDVENTQRTRGFLFTALGVAAASVASVRDVLVFENGYGALNPRLVACQRGAMTTKSTHPFILNRLESVCCAAGFDVSLTLPCHSRTKAEVLASIPRALLDGIQYTASCDGFPLRTKHSKQCGVCGSCILRRQALARAGLLAYDRHDYAAMPFESGAVPTVMHLMAYQAREFLAHAEGDYMAEATARWPEVMLGESDPQSEAGQRRLCMLRRYGLEWRSLVAGNPDLSARLGWSVSA